MLRSRMKEFTLLTLVWNLVMLLSLISVTASYEERKNETVVKTRIGTFIGTYRDINAFGKEVRVERFFGIPYAEPPIGDLRFRKPVPKRPLTSPFKAIKHGSVCYQNYLFNFRKSDIVSNEDCLYLNVYSPGTEKNDLAVMVWIHGGGFVAWESNPFVSDLLAAHGDVIVVTFNYRLSLWGFLSTEDEHSPGNYGLFDQHLAIKWVHENIRAFGGDSNRVTIFGESAGGASVLYQSMYEENRGLFHRVIAQSGSPSTLWASTGVAKQDAEKLGSIIGCESLETDELMECLRKVHSNVLNDTLNDVRNGFFRWPCPFVPNIDGEFVKKSPKHMFDIDTGVKSDEIEFFHTLDFLTGIVEEEGAFAASPLAGVEDGENFSPNRTFYQEQLIPHAISYPLGTDIPQVIKDLITQEYTDWSDPEDMEKIRSKLMQIYADFMFSVPMNEALVYHTSMKKPSTNKYQYVFGIKPSFSVIPMASWVNRANHGDDLEFIFFDETEGLVTHLPWTQGYRPADWEKYIADYMITMWSNFAKSG